MLACYVLYYIFPPFLGILNRYNCIRGLQNRQVQVQSLNQFSLDILKYYFTIFVRLLSLDCKWVHVKIYKTLLKVLTSGPSVMF